MTDSVMQDLMDEIRMKRIENLDLTRKERLFKNKYKFRSKLLHGIDVPLSAALEIRFRRSVFGTFMECFNYQQEQDNYLNNIKSDILQWNMKSFSEDEKANFEELNNISDNFFALFWKAIEKCDCINWNYFFDNLNTLRLPNHHITCMDDTLRSFKNLQILILGGNWIREVPGEYLPRKLRFLELFANVISNVSSLGVKPPKTLLHIGLSRNDLNNDSKLAEMTTCGKFNSLKSLDLSANDIFNLMDVLESVQSLEKLICLQLEGNPCATSYSYQNAIFKYLPHLVYLDNTKILHSDKHHKKFKPHNLSKAALTFTCHRIFGLQAPPKQKGVIQCFHLEVSLPLLEEIVIEPEEVAEVEDENLTEANKKNKKGSKKGSKKDSKKGSKKDSKKGSKKKSGKASSKKSKKGGKKGGKESVYNAEDEYEQEVKNRVKNTSFKTERINWSKIIQYPEDALIVESPPEDLLAMRNTFRSTVNVKLIYLKIEPPQKQKGKKGKKGKDKKGKKEKKEKKEKKSKKGKKGDSSASEKGKVVEEPKEPQETILKKITLANFSCDLHSINWSDKTVDFYWAVDLKNNQKATRVEGSLRDVIYVEGKGKKSAGKDKKKKEVGETAEAIVEEVSNTKSVLPKVFTCQVGFGLKRLL